MQQLDAGKVRCVVLNTQKTTIINLFVVRRICTEADSHTGYKGDNKLCGCHVEIRHVFDDRGASVRFTATGLRCPKGPHQDEPDNPCHQTRQQTGYSSL